MFSRYLIAYAIVKVRRCLRIAPESLPVAEHKGSSVHPLAAIPLVICLAVKQPDNLAGPPGAAACGRARGRRRAMLFASKPLCVVPSAAPS